MGKKVVLFILVVLFLLAATWLYLHWDDLMYVLNNNCWQVPELDSVSAPSKTYQLPRRLCTYHYTKEGGEDNA